MIVKFQNGKYGIRKGFLFYKYLDLGEHEITWRSINNKYYNTCCQGTLERVLEFYQRIDYKGTLVLANPYPTKIPPRPQKENKDDNLAV